jgi:SWIM zinc finger
MCSNNGKCWKNCAPFALIQLEPGGHCYKVTHSKTNIFQTNHVVDIQKKECSCGLWQEFGIPCLDAMAYYHLQEKKKLNDIMASDAVSNFHKYLFYHELIRININLFHSPAKKIVVYHRMLCLNNQDVRKLIDSKFGQNVVNQKIQASFAAFVIPEDTINGPVLH